MVEATPIRQRRRVALFMVGALVAIATIVGVVVGLARMDRSVPSPDGPAPSPTSAPTRGQFEESFRSTLSPHTLEALREPSSPQYRALEWVVGHYRALGPLLDDQDGWRRAKRAT
jgi:hypothetical protein